MDRNNNSPEAEPHLLPRQQAGDVCQSVRDRGRYRHGRPGGRHRSTPDKETARNETFKLFNGLDETTRLHAAQESIVRVNSIREPDGLADMHMLLEMDQSSQRDHAPQG